METTTSLATTGQWFDIYRLFMKQAIVHPLYSLVSPMKLAKSIRAMIHSGFVVCIWTGDEVQGYLGVGMGGDWWTDVPVIQELFVLGKRPGMGKSAIAYLQSCAKLNDLALITSGNALSSNQKEVANMYHKYGYRSYQTFYKEVSAWN